MDKRRANEPKVLRLKEVYNESGYRSVNKFAQYLGANQPTVANYMCGYRMPPADFLIKVCEKFPQYNQKWLIDGEGDKYNPIYVDIGGCNFSSPSKQEVITTAIAKDDKEMAMSAKMVAMAEKMSAMAERMAALVDKCSELSEQLRAAEDIIQTLRKQQT